MIRHKNKIMLWNDRIKIERKRHKKLISEMSHGEIQFYFGIRNNQVVKLDKGMQEDEIAVN
jgi:hypothetical protein